VDPALIDTYSDRTTVITLCDFAIENALTKEILSHLDKIEALTEQSFDNEYYQEKYHVDNCWQHWYQIGKARHYNPIDRRTITNVDQTLIILAVLQSLMDAITHKYKRILILIDPCHVDLSRCHAHKLAVFQCNQQQVGYLLPGRVFRELLTELSYFINTLPEVVDACIISNKWESHYYEVAQHTVECFSLSDTIDIDEDCTKILKARDSYLAPIFRKAMKGIDNDEQVQFVKHITKQYPYSKIRSLWNRYFNLNPNNYVQLCLLLPKFTYFTLLKIKAASDTGLDDTVYFDRAFYLQLYPCYKDIFKQPEETYQHFIRHGIGERLLPNLALFKLTVCSQEYQTQQSLAKVPKILKDIPTDPLIYILTRTCNREKLFGQCVNSVLSQKYPKMRHIVSYDNKETASYVAHYQHIYKVVDLIAQKSKLHPNQYIDCLYDYIPKNEPGWVLVIDDDDKFMTDVAIHYLKSYLTDPKKLIIWMLHRPDKYIYPRNKDLPVVGEIGTCCYLYHSSVIQKGHWGLTGIGDFTFFRWIFGRLKERIYIDIPFTGVNYQEQVSGWCAM